MNQLLTNFPLRLQKSTGFCANPCSFRRGNQHFCTFVLTGTDNFPKNKNEDGMCGPDLASEGRKRVCETEIVSVGADVRSQCECV